MSEQSSRVNHLSAAATSILRAKTTVSDAVLSNQHIAQDVFVIWLDPDFDQSKQNCQNTLIQLRNIVSHVNTFNQPDERVDFLTDAYDTKIFLILSGPFNKQLVSIIHDISQIHVI